MWRSTSGGCSGVVEASGEMPVAALFDGARATAPGVQASFFNQKTQRACLIIAIGIADSSH
jgi:hypothetical protein